MAYLDLDDIFAAPAKGRLSVAAANAPAAADFSPLEWRVIALARRDSLRSLARPSRLSRVISGLFGRNVSAELANPRLETLRRLAVYTWHRGFALPEGEIARFLAAGYSRAQVETLVTSVTGLRIDEVRRAA